MTERLRSWEDAQELLGDSEAFEFEPGSGEWWIVKDWVGPRQDSETITVRFRAGDGVLRFYKDGRIALAPGSVQAELIFGGFNSSPILIDMERFDRLWVRRKDHNREVPPRQGIGSHPGDGWIWIGPTLLRDQLTSEEQSYFRLRCRAHWDRYGWGEHLTPEERRDWERWSRDAIEEYEALRGNR